MFRSNFIKTILLLTVIVVSVSCSKEDDPAGEPEAEVVLETKTYANLHAPQTGGQGQPVGGSFVKFSFAKNAIVTDNSWDLAFRGTTIIANGGAKIDALGAEQPERTGSAAVSIVSNTLDGVKAIPEAATFKQDGSDTYAIANSSGNGWYNYDGQTHLITPVAGKILVVKTHDGKYAKVEILSYYKNAPASPNAMSDEARYFTFRYVYQPEGTKF